MKLRHLMMHHTSQVKANFITIKIKFRRQWTLHISLLKQAMIAVKKLHYPFKNITMLPRATPSVDPRRRHLLPNSNSNLRTVLVLLDRVRQINWFRAMAITVIAILWVPRRRMDKQLWRLTLTRRRIRRLNSWLSLILAVPGAVNHLRLHMTRVRSTRWEMEQFVPRQGH